VIREADAKVPTDLGGILYLKLASRTDISSIEAPLRQYLKRILSPELTDDGPRPGIDI
jgi:hypothetical protein